MPMTVIVGVGVEDGREGEERRRDRRGTRLLSRAPKSTMMMFEQGGFERDVMKFRRVGVVRAVL